MDTSFKIALDFDGTIKLPNCYETTLENSYLSYGFGKVYDWGIRHGVHFILWTCRNLENKKELNFVCDFLIKYKLYKIYIPIIELSSNLICKNLEGNEIKIFTSGSKKLNADLFIDNKNVGIPFLENSEQLDWTKILLKIRTLI